jgi:hypothetical protein
VRAFRGRLCSAAIARVKPTRRNDMSFIAPSCAAPEIVWDAKAQLGEGL